MRLGLATAALALAARAGLGAVPSPAPAATPTPSPAPTTAPSPHANGGLPVGRIEALISAAMLAHGIPGLTVSVATERELRWSNGYGMADLENFVPARELTVYRLASVTKPITATAVLQLAEQGKLDLDAPVQKYVPDFPEKAWPVTSRQLLAHQGGVRNWTEEEFRSTRRYASLSDALTVFKDDPLLQEPGTKVVYSSYGYNLLGSVVEGASGQRYLDYLTEHVFEPAGMVWARADDVFAIIPNRARGYQRTADGAIMNSSLSDTSNRVPGGGLVATADDVARFAVALVSGVLVKPDTLKLMFTRQKLRHGTSTGFGLGFVLGTHRRHREVYHLGGQPRVSTLLYMRPDEGLAVVLLTNLEGVGNPLLDLARQIADLAAP
ncbi:MAG TPA: serine hydrolase domain-containing protein [Vicinamibacteria bacterium]